MDAAHDRHLAELTAAIVGSYARHGELTRLESGTLPGREPVWSAVEDLLRILFPGFLEPPGAPAADFAARTAARVRAVQDRLRVEIEKGLRFQHACEDDECVRRAVGATFMLLDAIPAIREVIATDIEAAYDGDPAATSLEEIILAYPGLQAIAVYRLAHVLHAADIPIVPRVMTEYAHSRTGIDIHPGARIGRRFFIDHGTGVVIGETCTIGDNVKIYQGVTLGARSFPHDERGRIIKGTKRHPDIEENVTIYSGASILGPIRIGRGSVVGGNVWLTQSVPPDTRIVVRTPQQMHIDRDVSDYQI
jgi:serine O-acetyltransferase